MGTQDATTTVYREHNIVINPSGNPEDALTDAFLILEPSTNPMFTRTLYEHPRNEIKSYGSEEEARTAAMQLAREVIDKHLGSIQEASP